MDSATLIARMRVMIHRRGSQLLLIACSSLSLAACAAAPRSVAETSSATTSSASVCNAVWHDVRRDRDVPVRVRVPAGTARVPVVLFSHGLGGSLDAGTQWGEAWSEGGIAVVHLQHPGSDESLWREERSAAARLQALRRGMTAQQLIDRAADVSFVLDQLARTTGSMGAAGACDLTRIDMSRIGMSGHSFGAHTTQAIAGQFFPGAVGTLRDARVKSAIAFSPSPPAVGGDAAARAAFARMEIPFFSITGTRDEVPALTDVSPEQRTLPYRFMPVGGKYLLVMDGADHAAFGGNPAGALRRNQDDHVGSTVKTVTLAFWRATLLDDAAARATLHATPRLLRPGDRFESK
jgi:predicted dienelactone hydrolase